MTGKGSKGATVENRPYFNRELSWLEFNGRVLEEAKDLTNPLMERAKFLSIVSSNLDEFFMIRVAGLKDRAGAGLSYRDPAGLTPQEQLQRITARVHEMVKVQYYCFNRSLCPRLWEHGIYLKKYKELDEEQRAFCAHYLKEHVIPWLRLIPVSREMPFPLLLNKALYMGMTLKNKKTRQRTYELLQLPDHLERLIRLPGSGSKLELILLEELIAKGLKDGFPGLKVMAGAAFRVTRKADLNLEEEDPEDLMVEIEKWMRMRKWSEAVRLELDSKMSGELKELIQEGLGLEDQEVYQVSGPLDLTFLMGLYGMVDQPALRYGQHKAFKADWIASQNHSIFDAIREQDRLLHHPYDSFETVVELVRQAAADPDVLEIKQTLYRVSGNSPIMEALAQAAASGKQVTVLLELKARFEEASNVQWARYLEKYGCQVIHGRWELKTHCKLLLVVRQEQGERRRYVHMGTGNYNEQTARFYTDVSLFTSDPLIGEDSEAIFRWLTGQVYFPVLKRCILAPFSLRNQILTLIEREIIGVKKGGSGHIIAKMNSLVDVQVIQALYAASQAGVKIQLIVRGICCLRPDVPGLSEHIQVRSLVGRFLEHSRIFYFYNQKEENLFLSSSDWMPRNFDRRVELMMPVLDGAIKHRILETLKLELADNMKARALQPDGNYEKIKRKGKASVNAQELFQIGHRQSPGTSKK